MNERENALRRKKSTPHINPSSKMLRVGIMSTNCDSDPKTVDSWFSSSEKEFKQEEGIGVLSKIPEVHGVHVIR